MQKIFTLLFISIICITPVTKSFAQVNPSDSLALVNLYDSTNGASWTNKTGWLSGPVSSWYNVFLSSDGHNVTAINLSNNNLSGTIPVTLGNLTSLALLDLSINNITGTIPYSLGNTILTTLSLNNNQLTGPIPGTLGNLVNLGDLELDNNNLTGSIPDDSLQALLSLSTLDLSTNQLSGSIPSFLGTLSSLSVLKLYSNHLSGSIPLSLATSTSIGTLSLNSNQLSGTIPSSLGSSSSIISINLNHNQLTGTIPSALGNASLYTMDISYNQLIGTVPASFINITSISSPTTTLINNNKLTFDGLETIVQAPDYNPGLTFIDSPQSIIPLHLNSGTLSMYAGGTLAKDTFYWYKNGVLNNTIIGDSTFTPSSGGNYSVVVKNAIVSHATGLVLYSDTLSAGVILPVSILNFTGHLENNIAQLQWQTTAEINAAYYNVQRSTDDINFTTIGAVDATGSGTGIQNYTYADNLSALVEQPENLYYRLQEVDKNGQYLFSNIVNIPLNATLPAISIYPNPVSNFVSVAIPNNLQPVVISVIDANGVRLLEQTQTGNLIRIDVSDLATGIYFIQVTVNGTTSQQKFIKE